MINASSLQLIGLVVFFINQATTGGTAMTMVRAAQYQMFWHNLAAMLNSGMLPLRALRELVGFELNTDEFDYGIQIITEVFSTGEAALYEAMDNTGMFSRFEVSIINAGESNGSLEIAVNRLATSQGIGTRADQYFGFWAGLGNLLATGVPLIWSLGICAEKLDGPFQQDVMKIYDSVSNRCSMAEVMYELGRFSSIENGLIDDAEENGTLNSAVMKLAEMSKPINW